MVAPSQDGDIVLGGTILLRDPSGPTTSGYQAWVLDFNAFPPVELSTNDKPVVYGPGIVPGGDMALGRRYTFELRADWSNDVGFAALLADLTTVGTPLQADTTTLAFKLAGIVWTVNGRYEPISASDTTQMVAHRTGSWEVRFRGTDPVLHGSSGLDIL